MIKLRWVHILPVAALAIFGIVDFIEFADDAHIRRAVRTPDAVAFNVSMSHC